MEAGKQKKKKKKKKTGIILAVITGIFRLLLAAALMALFIQAAIGLSQKSYQMGYRVFTEPAVEDAPGQDILVSYSSDMDGKALGSQLEEKGLVKDGSLFYIQYRLSAYYNKLIPGSYVVNTSMTAKEMLVLMSTETDVESTETGGQ